MAGSRPSSGLRLTGRDERLLLDLYASRLLSRDQILRLGYFGSVQRCNMRLLKLRLAGFVRRLEKPYGVSGGQSLYLPGRGAALLACRHLGSEKSEALRVCRDGVSPVFLEHTLRATDFRVSLVEHAPAAGASLERWLPESACYHEYEVRGPGGRWETRSLRPDGFARLKLSGRPLDCFAEVDLGHVSARLFKDKVERYRDYLRDGIFEETYRSRAFRVLVATTSERRLLNLLALTGAEEPRFLFARLEDIDVLGPFAPVWTAAGADRPLTLSGGLP